MVPPNALGVNRMHGVIGTKERASTTCRNVPLDAPCNVEEGLGSAW